MLPFYKAEFEWFPDILERYTQAELEALRVKDGRYAIAWVRRELKTADNKIKPVLKRMLKRALSQRRRRKKAMTKTMERTKAKKTAVSVAQLAGC